MKFFEDFNKFGETYLKESIEKPRLMMCPQGIITYRLYKKEGVRVNEGAMLGYMFSKEEIEGKIKEIAAANPDALSSDAVQRSLGVNILSFDRNKN